MQVTKYGFVQSITFLFHHASWQGVCNNQDPMLLLRSFYESGVSGNCVI
jgi:hypothetical protein